MDYQNITTTNIDKLMRFLAARHADEDCTLVLCMNDAVLRRFSTSDYRMEALMVEGPMEKVYTMYLRFGKEVNARIVCHEFIHFEQMLRGDLSVDMKRGEFTWQGSTYPASYPYDKRPWEREARAGQDKLYREYKKAIRTNY